MKRIIYRHGRILNIDSASIHRYIDAYCGIIGNPNELYRDAKNPPVNFHTKIHKIVSKFTQAPCNIYSLQHIH